MLPDLNQIIVDIKRQLKEFPLNDISLNEQFKSNFKQHINKDGYDVLFSDHSAIIINPKKQRIYLSNSWFYLAKYAVRLAKAVKEYRDFTEKFIDDRFDDIKLISTEITDHKKFYEYFRKSPKQIDKEKITNIFLEELKKYNDITDIEGIADNLIKFITDYDWWLGGKTIDRSNDYYVSPVLGVLNLINASQSYIAEITRYYIENELLPTYLPDIKHTTENQKNTTFPRNRIIFGAPGTGKSHQLNDDAKKFFNQENDNDSDKNKIFAKIHTAFTNNNNFLQVLNAIGFSYCAEIKTLLNGNTSKKNIAETFFKDQLEHTKKHSADAFYFPLITKKEDFKYSGNGDFKSFFESKIQEFQKNQVGQETRKTPLFNALGYYNSEEILALLGFSEEDDIGNYNVVQTRYNLTTTEAQWLWRGVSAAQIELEQIKMNYVERVTFHPNYSYAHFVGTYKPVQDKDDPKQIRYEYVPGPFMRTLTKALNNPGSKFLLIIEEINRANVAAVFGDVFQLLDRDDKGTSEYPIVASEDIKKYLKDEIKTGNIDLEQIRIPSNMYIWATMNSADQGVFPMDAAFKRRWNFEYLGIDTKANDAKGDIPIGSPNGTTDFDMINWNKFRTKLNEKLKSLDNIRVNEDKLLGPFFISQSDIKKSNTDYESKKQFRDKFKSKVLMYLFEDVVKMNPGNLFVCGKNNPHFSEICQTFDDKGIKELFGFTDEEYGEMKA